MRIKQILWIVYLLCGSFLLASTLPAQDEETPAGVSMLEPANNPPAGEAQSTRPTIDWQQLKILELDEDGINWQQDWWKYLLMLLLGLLCLCLVVYLTKVLFWLFGVLVCLGSGIAGGIFLEALFSPWLPPLLPASVTELVSASLICHILGGLLGYGLAACCLGILLKPLKTKKKNA